eukprot:7993206-Pyramimonas_sp.AAC.1
MVQASVRANNKSVYSPICKGHCSSKHEVRCDDREDSRGRRVLRSGPVAEDRVAGSAASVMYDVVVPWHKGSL